MEDTEDFCKTGQTILTMSFQPDFEEQDIKRSDNGKLSDLDYKPSDSSSSEEEEEEEELQLNDVGYGKAQAGEHQGANDEGEAKESDIDDITGIHSKVSFVNEKGYVFTELDFDEEERDTKTEVSDLLGSVEVQLESEFLTKSNYTYKKPELTIHDIFATLSTQKIPSKHLKLSQSSLNYLKYKYPTSTNRLCIQTSISNLGPTYITFIYLDKILLSLGSSLESQDEATIKAAYNATFNKWTKGTIFEYDWTQYCHLKDTKGATKTIFCKTDTRIKRWVGEMESVRTSFNDEFKRIRWLFERFCEGMYQEEDDVDGSDDILVRKFLRSFVDLSDCFEEEEMSNDKASNIDVEQEEVVNESYYDEISTESDSSSSTQLKIKLDSIQTQSSKNIQPQPRPSLKRRLSERSDETFSETKYLMISSPSKRRRLELELSPTENDTSCTSSQGMIFSTPVKQNITTDQNNDNIAKDFQTTFKAGKNFEEDTNSSFVSAIEVQDLVYAYENNENDSDVFISLDDLSILDSDISFVSALCDISCDSIEDDLTLNGDETEFFSAIEDGNMTSESDTEHDDILDEKQEEAEEEEEEEDSIFIADISNFGTNSQLEKNQKKEIQDKKGNTKIISTGKFNNYNEKFSIDTDPEENTISCIENTVTQKQFNDTVDGKDLMEDINNIVIDSDTAFLTTCDSEKKDEKGEEQPQHLKEILLEQEEEEEEDSDIESNDQEGAEIDKDQLDKVAEKQEEKEEEEPQNIDIQRITEELNDIKEQALESEPGQQSDQEQSDQEQSDQEQSDQEPLSVFEGISQSAEKEEIYQDKYFPQDSDDYRVLIPEDKQNLAEEKKFSVAVAVTLSQHKELEPMNELKQMYVSSSEVHKQNSDMNIDGTIIEKISEPPYDRHFNSESKSIDSDNEEIDTSSIKSRDI